MKLEDIADNLVLGKDQIYYSMSYKEVSYPSDGNQRCQQIEEDSFWFDHRNEIIAEVVLKSNFQGMFFDLGGGNGVVAKKLQDVGVDVTLVEPGVLGCKNARNRNIVNIVCSTLSDAGFAESKMAAVGVFDVIEHIEDDEAFLKEIQRYLRKEGLLFITVPAYQFLWSAADIQAGHFRRYSIIKLKKVLDKAGLRVQFATYFFSFLPLAIFLFRVVPSWFRKNVGPTSISKRKSEHKNRDGPIAGILERILRWERLKISKRQKVPFGASCLIIAKKI